MNTQWCRNHNSGAYDIVSKYLSDQTPLLATERSQIMLVQNNEEHNIYNGLEVKYQLELANKCKFTGR